jgi:uncharacterized protein YjbJ (UPF0337 family)
LTLRISFLKSGRKPSEVIMTDSKTDKSEGIIDRASGKAKEALGKVTDEKETEAKGKNQTSKGHAKQAKGELKDALKSGDSRRSEDR